MGDASQMGGVMKRTLQRAGISLVEVMVSVMILSFTLPASMIGIQWGRKRSLDTSLEMTGQNLAVSLMEMIKHDYAEIRYGGSLADLIPESTVPILNFPTVGMANPSNPTLPAGAAGNATGPEAYNLSNGQAPSAITSNSNYLTLTANQIAMLNGYPNASAAAGKPLLDANLAWGVYIEDQAASSKVSLGTYKLVIVVVKWRARQGAVWRYTTLRTIISDRQSRI